MSMWSDIVVAVKSILDNDATVQSLVETVRIGLPINNILPANYPVLLIGRCTLISSEYRGTGHIQDRLTVWNLPVFIGYKSSIADIEDGSAYSDIDAVEQAVLDAILSADEFNNESPYLGIDIANSELDTETMPPYLGQIYNFEVRKINSF